MLLYHCIFHLTIYSINLFHLCGGINLDYDCSIDYELRLRQLDFTDPVKVPIPLYYYRVHKKSMTYFFRKNGIGRANALRASNEAIKRRGLSGDVFYEKQRFCRRF
jgi:hypothetical protein